jgi:hypothetical protein
VGIYKGNYASVCILDNHIEMIFDHKDFAEEKTDNY